MQQKQLNVLMRKYTSIFIISIMSILPASNADAGVPVIDLALIGVENGWWGADAAEQAIQTGEQVITSAENILQTVESVAQTVQQIQMVYRLIQMLSQLGASEWIGLVNDNVIQSDTISTVMATASDLEYKANNMKNQFDALFPQNGDWTNITPGQIAALRNSYRGNMSKASYDSMRAQGLLDELINRGQKISNLILQSKASDGQVKQLQVSNQMLGSVSTSINDLNMLTATNNRVHAMKEAIEVARIDSANEIHSRLSSDFANPGAPVSAPSTLYQVK